MARVGEILVPQIIFLKHIHPILPPLIIGSFCLIGATTRSELSIDISDKGDVKGEDNLGPYQGHYVFSPKSPYTLEDHNVLFVKTDVYSTATNELYKERRFSYFMPDTTGNPLMQTSHEAFEFYQASKSKRKSLI